MPIKHLLSDKTLRISQDGSRKFISLLTIICANGTALAPALIYQEEIHDLQDTWLEDFDHSSDKTHFTVSKKGWTNEELGFSWLSTIFKPSTRAKAGNSRRILIVNGYSSHLNMRFIDYYDAHNILLAILPPHSMH